ncbi:15414_t:CDS:2, partial [Cetraspora pellucida]
SIETSFNWNEIAAGKKNVKEECKDANIEKLVEADAKAYKEATNYGENIDNALKTYKIEFQLIYKDLYEKLTTKYSILLKNIRANELYFNYQKQTKSNSLFKLLYNLNKRKYNSYDIEKAQKEFETVTSPSFSALNKHFKEIVNNNLYTEIYYRYNSNCDITNYLSLEKFSMSKKSTLKDIFNHYDLAE